MLTLRVYRLVKIFIFFFKRRESRKWRKRQKPNFHTTPVLISSFNKSRITIFFQFTEMFRVGNIFFLHNNICFRPPTELCRYLTSSSNRIIRVLAYIQIPQQHVLRNPTTILPSCYLVLILYNIKRINININIYTQRVRDTSTRRSLNHCAQVSVWWRNILLSQAPSGQWFRFNRSTCKLLAAVQFSRGRKPS